MFSFFCVIKIFRCNALHEVFSVHIFVEYLLLVRAFYAWPLCWRFFFLCYQSPSMLFCSRNVSVTLWESFIYSKLYAHLQTQWVSYIYSVKRIGSAYCHAREHRVYLRQATNLGRSQKLPGSLHRTTLVSQAPTPRDQSVHTGFNHSVELSTWQ